MSLVTATNVNKIYRAGEVEVTAVKRADFEIEQAKQKNRAFLVVKMNSLVDKQMIEKLYEASAAGVIIKLIIRGACSIKPGMKGISENIAVISIVDRFLEHSRTFYFYHGGEELMYISSADWMVRNLDNRIELTCPIYDEEIKKELKQMLTIQLKDNVKARILDLKQVNSYVQNNKPEVRAQVAYYQYLKRKLKEKDNKK